MPFILKEIQSQKFATDIIHCVISDYDRTVNLSHYVHGFGFMVGPFPWTSHSGLHARETCLPEPLAGLTYCSPSF